MSNIYACTNIYTVVQVTCQTFKNVGTCTFISNYHLFYHSPTADEGRSAEGAEARDTPRVRRSYYLTTHPPPTRAGAPKARRPEIPLESEGHIT